MKKFWRKYLLIFGIAALSGGMLLVTSQNVERKETQLRNLRSAMEAEKESLRVLRAEWAYVNRPDHLEALANQYLDLIPPQAGQTVSDAAAMQAAPLIEEEIEEEEKAMPVSAQVPQASSPATMSPPAVIPPRKPGALAKPQRRFQNMLEELTGNGGADVQ